MGKNKDNEAEFNNFFLKRSRNSKIREFEKLEEKVFDRKALVYGLRKGFHEWKTNFVGVCIKLYEQLARPIPAVMFIIFLMLTLFGDKHAQRNIKYKKSLCPNLVWKYIVLFMYLPAWVQLIGGHIFKLFLNTAHLNPGHHMIARQIYQELSLPIWYMTEIESNFRMKMPFESIYYIFLYFGLKGYMKEKWDIHKGDRRPETKFLTHIQLPMYFKYHLMFIAIFESIYMTLKWQLDQFLNFILQFFVPASERFPFVFQFNVCYVIFMLLLISNVFLKAMKGISFTSNGLIDNFVKVHLGAECIDPLEDWTHYGMDDFKKGFY